MDCYNPGSCKDGVPTMNFLPDRFNLPLFMYGRNKIRLEAATRWRTHVRKKMGMYSQHCVEEMQQPSERRDRMRHLVGLEFRKSQPCAQPRMLKASRDLVVAKPYHLAPNRYGSLPEPFKGREGLKGAHWNRTVPKKRVAIVKNHRWKFYEINRESERMTTFCHKHKGFFGSNARNSRPSNRSMVSNPLTCYRNPNDPGPTSYYPHQHEIEYNLSEPDDVPLFNPHIFLRNSCVPLNVDSLHKKHISFVAGPGRYENRYRDVCHCSADRIYMPGYQTLIDREKRLKFRREPYTRIRAAMFCSPEWRHVVGHGHRRLFMGSHRTRDWLTKGKQDEKKRPHQAIKLFPEAKYINMIMFPSRLIFSRREEPMVVLPQKVVFNCIARPVVRKQLRNNKKIAFSSGQERFKDSPKMRTFTVSEMEELKSRLPVERQLRDHPIMERCTSEIWPRLYDDYKIRAAGFDVKLRKRLFKFLPLPDTKMLVTDFDKRPIDKNGRFISDFYYNKAINPETFMTAKFTVPRRTKAL